MIAAAPRKKAKGEASMRLYRSGTNSGTRVRACCRSTSTGSGRPASGTHLPCAERGVSARAFRPKS